MPRIARKKLNTPYLHVMVQGVNKEYIFEKEKYLKYYLNSIMKCRDINGFELIAYCMMNNHAHFLFYVADLDEFEDFMKKVNQKFAMLYNANENRVGVVFRNRYKVEPIYDSSYLKNCIKYIHDNPVKAKMVRQSKDYKYSSYNDYLYKKGVSKIKVLSQIFGDNVNYIKMIDEATDIRFIDFERDKRIDNYISSGVGSFIKEYHYRLIDLFSEKEILQKLLVYLKIKCNIQYSEAMRNLKLSRRIIRKINEVEL